MAIRYSIIDDHPLMRLGIKQTLDDQGGFELVSVGSCGADAIRIAEEAKSEIMLVDINMPGDGLEALREIREKGLATPIVMFTIFDNYSNVRRAMQLGASGFMPKGADGRELAAMMRDVLTGRTVVHPDLAARLFSENNTAEPAPLLVTQTDVAGMRSLTDREREILNLIGRGQTNADIATALDLKEATVKHYLTIMFQKLGVRNRTEAALLVKK
jgi:two-component system nitrate/nitrite response regulator NarL